MYNEDGPPAFYTVTTFCPQLCTTHDKTMRFPISEVQSNQVFLAHSVNGSRLPVKHGFPIRTVAESYYGDDWIKYVYRIEAVKIEG